MYCTGEKPDVQLVTCSISLTHTCWFKEGILKQQNFTGISLVVKNVKDKAFVAITN